MDEGKAIDFDTLKKLMFLIFPDSGSYTSSNCLGFKSNGVWHPISNIQLEIYKNAIILKELSKVK